MTGMSLSRAFWIGSLKATGSTTETAMPSALPEMAVFMASTISLTTESSEPVHCDVVLSRYEERVRRHMVDEDEVPLRRLRKVAARPASSALARLLRSLTPASFEQ